MLRSPAGTSDRGSLRARLDQNSGQAGSSHYCRGHSSHRPGYADFVRKRVTSAHRSDVASGQYGGRGPAEASAPAIDRVGSRCREHQPADLPSSPPGHDEATEQADGRGDFRGNTAQRADGG
jgi:hypothetical protein